MTIQPVSATIQQKISKNPKIYVMIFKEIRNGHNECKQYFSKKK